jgi:hypothetical protein
LSGGKHTHLGTEVFITWTRVVWITRPHVLASLHLWPVFVSLEYAFLPRAELKRLVQDPDGMVAAKLTTAV